MCVLDELNALEAYVGFKHLALRNFKYLSIAKNTHSAMSNERMKGKDGNEMQIEDVGDNIVNSKPDQVILKSKNDNLGAWNTVLRFPKVRYSVPFGEHDELKLSRIFTLGCPDLQSSLHRCSCRWVSDQPERSVWEVRFALL